MIACNVALNESDAATDGDNDANVFVKDAELDATRFSCSNGPPLGLLEVIVS